MISFHNHASATLLPHQNPSLFNTLAPMRTGTVFAPYYWWMRTFLPLVLVFVFVSLVAERLEAIPRNPSSVRPHRIALTSNKAKTLENEKYEHAQKLFAKAGFFNEDEKGFEAIQVLRELIRDYPNTPLAEAAKLSIHNIENSLRNYLQTDVEETHFFLRNRESGAARDRIDFIERKWPEHPELKTLKEELQKLEQSLR